MKVIVTGSSRVFNTENVETAIELSGLSVSEFVTNGFVGINTVIRSIAKDRNIPIKQFSNGITGMGTQTIFGNVINPIVNINLTLCRDMRMMNYADALIVLHDPGNKNENRYIDLAKANKKIIFIHTTNEIKKIESYSKFIFLDDFPKLIDDYIPYHDNDNDSYISDSDTSSDLNDEWELSEYTDNWSDYESEAEPL